MGFFKRKWLTFPKTYRRRDVRPWVNFISSRDTNINCGGYVSLISFSVFCFQIIAGNTLVFLNYLEQEKTTRMAFSPECITWMVVGLTESVTIIALNSLTVIAFFRDRSLRKRSTYLVISLAVADMFTGGTSPLDLFYNVGETCNFWRHKREHWYRIPQVFLFWFLVCSFINMTVISLERLNATFWPFRHRTIKKSVYWVLIIAIWLTTLLFCALTMKYHHAYKEDYYHYAWGSFISICLLVICVSYVFIFVKLRFGNQPRHHGAANRERKLTVTLFTVTSLSLSLLWLPYVITSFLFFCYWHFQFIVWNSVSPFAWWFNCLVFRKLFFKSDIVYYENARF